MAKGIDNKIPDLQTPWEGYKGSRVEERIKGSLEELDEQLPSYFDSVTDEETGETSYWLMTKGGERVGANVITVPPAGAGGGSLSLTSLSITFEEDMAYRAYGSDIMVRAAIRSVTKEGDEVDYNRIRSVTIVDADTGVALWTDINRPSSMSKDDYSFTLDFTPYTTSAGSRRYNIVAVDSEGNTKNKDITVTAVDATVTVRGVQVLHYTSDNALAVGGNRKSIPMYRVASASRKVPVDVRIDAFHGGEWRELATMAVEDSSPRSVSIDPTNLLGGGERLEHGALPLRIQGTDYHSGVRGNVVYTSVMCVDADSAVPVLAMRYNDASGKVRLYDTVTVEVAAYSPSSVNTDVEVYENGVSVASLVCGQSMTYAVNRQVQGCPTDGSYSLEYSARAASGGTYATAQIPAIPVEGSAIDVTVKDGARLAYDFSSRNNDESDHTVSDGGYTMAVEGANWSSNGFVPYLGETALAIKENVTATVPYRPFASAALKSQGCAIQMAFATNNVADPDALLMECYDPDQGVGFYIKGNAVGIFVKGGEHEREERKFRCGEKVTLAVVVEPESVYGTFKNVAYSNVKMYLNGEEVACIGYKGTDSLTQGRELSFSGVSGDFYLYYLLVYNSHYEWEQAFRNYLGKLTDTTAMVTEYAAEDVLDERGEPTIASMRAKGIPYYVVVADQSVFDTFDGDTNTSTKFTCTLYYYNPQKPWLDFRATNVQWRRQGTTSAKRPIKNDRFYLNKPVNKSQPTVVTLLHDRSEYTDPAILAAYDRAAALAAINHVQVGDNSIPVAIITEKVDFSDSSNANDCGICDMMNATFRAAGPSYMTPAQRHYDGTFSKKGVTLGGLEMNHSTRNHPCAVFRATNETLTDAWFHAKGNWKEDKGEQVALGFKDTPGYNLGCLNYGDFYEFFGQPNELEGREAEGLDSIEARFRADWSANKVNYLDDDGKVQHRYVVLSLYCGRDYRVLEYSTNDMADTNGTWSVATGYMRQEGGNWVVSGKVLNPVTGFELLTYEGMCWWRGVGSVQDMMRMTNSLSSWVTKLNLSQAPAWTQYFECMVDDDQLAMDYALGKKVPYDLYAMLKFCNDCDFRNVAEDVWKAKWREELHNYANVRSLYTYTAFTDYLAATDQRAKNMQPMWFLEDGFSVENGVYSSPYALRMYLNKVYDCDTCNGKDNDGGCTVDAETDPNKPSVEGVYKNPYAGWDSILFNNVDRCPVVLDDDGASEISLVDVVKGLRTASATNAEGVQYVPFSPEGAMYHFVEKRLKFWPKLISSYDGERKYVKSLSRADAIYFYALQGLGLTALPRFIEQRWQYRDGYYQTGTFTAREHYFADRIEAPAGAAIRVKAAKSGYFGVGSENASTVKEAVYLEAGESYEFRGFDHGSGTSFFLYQADRLSELDLSEVGLSASASFSGLSLLEVLKLGGENRATIANGYGDIATLTLGNHPFMRELDVRNTTVGAVDASGCPRLEVILASGSRLSKLTMAQTAPVRQVSLPSTMTEMSFVNLPLLNYPMQGGEGLDIENVASLRSLTVDGCAGMDGLALLMAAVEAGAPLTAVRITGIKATASKSVLRYLMEHGTKGIDHRGNEFDEQGRCSGLVGEWVCAELLSTQEVNEIAAYFPELSIQNSQYTAIVFSDDVADPANITNLDNRTGYLHGSAYAPSGHISEILSRRHAVTGVYGGEENGRGVMLVKRLNDENFDYYADGTDAVLTGAEGDVFIHEPHYWYKGVDDYLNARRYHVYSALEQEPVDLGETTVEIPLESLSKTPDNALLYSGLEGQLWTTKKTYLANYSVYELPLTGYPKAMRQVRWPAVAGENHCAAFVDADGVALRVMRLVSYPGYTNGDYLFADIPEGAVTLVFTAPKVVPEEYADYCVLTSSAAAAAIESRWVEHDECLVGEYEASSGYRSLSGKSPISTSNTDAAAPVSARGAGYQLISYEMHKDVANLFFAKYGTRDGQGVCGAGSNTSSRTSGKTNTRGMLDTLSSESPSSPKVMGYDNWQGGKTEWMSGCVMPMNSLTAEIQTNEGTRRVTVVNTDSYTTGQGGYITYVRNGRWMDNLAVAAGSGGSSSTRYADIFSSGKNSRKELYPMRGGYEASLQGGLSYIWWYNGGNSDFGTRIAFSGIIREA